MIKQSQMCLECRYYNFETHSCKIDHDPNHGLTCTGFERIDPELDDPVEEAPAELDEDRQYWVMVPDMRSEHNEKNQYVALCFSTLDNLIGYCSKQYINLADTIILSAKPSRLKLIALDLR